MITFKARTANGEIINSALTPFTFPAGEAHIKREERRELEAIEIAILQPDADSLHTDLFHLAMWSNLTFASDSERVLVMPYAPGARADRGLPFGAEVYGDFISNMLLDQIIIFDPHSPTIVEELNYQAGGVVTPVYSDELFKGYKSLFEAQGYSGVIAPDKGAIGRAQKAADVLGVPLFKAEKTRDFETGKLTGFTCEDLPATGKLLLVDDIISGGGTFLGLADAIKLPRERLDLFASHGELSNNAVKALPEKFENIIITNSYAPTRSLGTMSFPNTFVRLDVIRLLLAKIRG